MSVRWRWAGGRVRGPGAAALVIGLLAVGLAPGRAEAQFGMGIGIGIGRSVPPPEKFLNSKALLNASQATMGPRGFNSANPYGNSGGNAYFNNIRDNNFTQRYAIDSRAEAEFRRVGRMSASRPVSTTPGQVAAPVVPLASFFDSAGQLVWPSESPASGDLRASRDASDRATLAVYDEVRRAGRAPLGLVTDARTKLVGYGQPALAFLRANTTARVSDTFHMFLLSLYESLGQAANPPRAVAAAPTPPVPPAPPR